MYNNPLKASDAVESKSWDKYVEKGKVSHRPKKEKKDKIVYLKKEHNKRVHQRYHLH